MPGNTSPREAGCEVPAKGLLDAHCRGARRESVSETVSCQGATVASSCQFVHRSSGGVSFRDDGAAALEWIASYLDGVRERRPVLAAAEPGAVRAALPDHAPESGEPFAAVLRDLDEVLMPGLTHWQSPRYFAYFPSTGSPAGVLAELLAAGLNQVGILWRTSPALQELEEVSLAWLAELLGLPPGLHGHLEDTASTGLVTALAAARAAAPGKRVVVCSEHTHSSTAKA